jgi:hypothetical protein
MHDAERVDQRSAILVLGLWLHRHFLNQQTYLLAALPRQTWVLQAEHHSKIALKRQALPLEPKLAQREVNQPLAPKEGQPEALVELVAEPVERAGDHPLQKGDCEELVDP